MKRMSTKFFLYSLTSLAVTASSVALAETPATAPTLEGGIYASIAALYAVPSSNNTSYAVNRTFVPGFFAPPLIDFGSLNTNTAHVNGEYDWGFEAVLGYAFDNTANGIELTYRGLNSNDSNNTTGSFLGFIPNSWISEGEQKNEYQNWDLMITQYLDIGTHFQMRFLGGLSYLSELEQRNDAQHAFIPFVPLFELDYATHAESEYSGWGPRLGIDGRYEFGTGFGIVGGGSAAFFIGDLDSTTTTATDLLVGPLPIDFHFDTSNTNNPDNHTVTNLRGNLGIDYVYYFENSERSSIGLELGYQVDTYFDGVAQVNTLDGTLITTDISFSGPYLNLKGAF